MTVNKVCHTTWEDVVIHVCGKHADHEGYPHLCACGAILLTARSTLTDEQRHQRRKDCPECLAKAGRPCHTTAGSVMHGIHASRSRLAGKFT